MLGPVFQNQRTMELFRSPGAGHREHSVNKRTVFTFERDEEV